MLRLACTPITPEAAAKVTTAPPTRSPAQPAEVCVRTALVALVALVGLVLDVLVLGVLAGIFLYIADVGLAMGMISQLFKMLFGMNPMCSVINMYFNRMLL